MLYLVDELFKQHGTTMHITIGAPIQSSVFDGSKSDHQWAQWMKEKVYALKNENDKDEAKQ